MSLTGGAASITIASGANSGALAIVRGQVQVSEVSAVGDTAVYLISQGVVVLMAQAGGGGWSATPTTTPAAGHYSLGFDSGTSTYRIYNNRGGSSIFNVLQLATT